MDQAKFVEDSWSILEYLFPYFDPQRISVDDQEYQRKFGFQDRFYWKQHEIKVYANFN